ncbi:diguanylate cyclase [Fictibacillus nanhaiensis]|uniref:diguanylate cyclase n=1 Tax=Fictibacillus nanhaiensis TaxID=742169 RepID=UPI001C9786E2|nr:diguanylate cyclase [Fictibacillus nanhaiensis]MBY6037598.1 diguanylate cyclase [Fictibacillus nanhaiensis]
MIIKELFANLAILIALLYLYTQVSTNYQLTTQSSVKSKVLTGVAGGVLGNILMQYSIQIGTTIIDLRPIPILLLAYFGGAIPAFISMVMIIGGRLLIGINISSYAAIYLMVSITLFSVLISKTKLTGRVKQFLMLTFTNIASTILFIYLIKDTNYLKVLIPVYWIVSYCSGYVAFKTVNLLRKSQQLFQKYKAASTVDPLTGLNNVRKFDEVFNASIAELEKKKKKLSLLYIDIDFFKKVNDTYGHAEGDVVLKELGHILRSCTRTFDIVSRNGGEEFTVLLLDCPLEEAVQIGERIRKTVEDNPFTLEKGGKINVTVSVGVSCYPETTEDVALIIKDADKALYEAKKSGRNMVCVANY